MEIRRSIPGPLDRDGSHALSDLARLQHVIRNVPIDVNAGWQSFNCRTRIWVGLALRAIEQDGGCIGTNVLDGPGWAALQQCENFANPIRQIRMGGQDLPDPRPVQDLVR
jgi:hypothetical protein